MHLFKDSVLVEDALHAANEHCRVERFGKHRAPHDIQAGCSIVWDCRGECDVAEALVLLWKPRLKRTAVIEPYRRGVLHVEALAHRPHHRCDCRVSPPHDSTAAEANGHELANGELDQEWICGLEKVATTLDRNACGEK